VPQCTKCTHAGQHDAGAEIKQLGKRRAGAKQQGGTKRHADPLVATPLGKRRCHGTKAENSPVLPERSCQKVFLVTLGDSALRAALQQLISGHPSTNTQVRIMGTKIYLTGLGILLLVCLGIGFSLGYGQVFRPGADGVPDQGVAQMPTVHASSTPHKPTQQG
jgi:hypothetical protein